VHVRVRMQGRHTGPFVLFRDGKLDKSVPPTGREIDYEQIHVLTVRDGKVVKHEAMRDDLTMLSQLGVFPPAPAIAARLAAWKLTGRRPTRGRRGLRERGRGREVGEVGR
jgi:hypothetical protein